MVTFSFQTTLFNMADILRSLTAIHDSVQQQSNGHYCAFKYVYDALSKSHAFLFGHYTADGTHSAYHLSYINEVTNVIYIGEESAFGHGDIGELHCLLEKAPVEIRTYHQDR